MDESAALWRIVSSSFVALSALLATAGCSNDVEHDDTHDAAQPPAPDAGDASTLDVRADADALADAATDVVTPLATANMMAGCSMYSNDPRLTRDILTEPLTATSDAEIAKAASWGTMQDRGDGDSYTLHLLADAKSPTTTLTQQTSHTFPGPFPIGQFLSQSALTGAAGDRPMEMIGQSGYPTTSGCQVFDGYYLTYIGTPGTYASKNMWSAYSACISDPDKNMVSETCNSNISLSGVEIAAGTFPEQLQAVPPAGWSTLNHAVLLETPGIEGDGTISESGDKLRLRVCGVTDYTHAGTRCISMPSQTTHPEGYKLVQAMMRYGAIVSDNGCCFGLARHYLPQLGHSPIDYADINGVTHDIGIADFDVLDKND